MSAFRCINMLAAFLLGSGVAICQQPAPPAGDSAPTNRQYFQARGVVKEVDASTRTAVIQHDEIPGYMPAMTMPFEVRDTNELRGLQAGATIAFRMVIAGKDGWIDQISNLDEPRTLAASTPPAWRVTRDVEPLNLGDPLPDYHFTNELGNPISTGQFKGQALAFTFFFTRCPFPTFCPLMSSNFNEAQKKLQAMTNGPANWHLLSISFDPAHDSPQVLKAYAGRYDRDPAKWSFATGDLVDLTAIADQVGENFWHDGDSISHNLRTVVVDAKGRLQAILIGNAWTSDELVTEIVKAAAVKP